MWDVLIAVVRGERPPVQVADVVTLGQVFRPNIGVRQRRLDDLRPRCRRDLTVAVIERQSKEVEHD